MIETAFEGKVPLQRSDLLKLPGVGLYISNAVRSFAFNAPVPILDTNTIRIFDRLFGLRSKLARARTDKTLETEIGNYLPKHNSREFNYALLDFGALVCTAQRPKCEACPLRSICQYYRGIRPEE